MKNADGDNVKVTLEEIEGTDNVGATVGRESASEMLPEHEAHVYDKDSIDASVIPLWRECMGELMGTATLLAFGNGVVAQYVISEGGAGSYLAIAFTWGFAVTAGIYVSKGNCPSHLNPAVTLSFALFRGFEWWKAPFYMLSQLIGAMIGAFLVWTVYFPGKDDSFYVQGTAGIFATYPGGGASNLLCFWTEIVGTAMLMFGIFVVGEGRSNEPTMPGHLGPIMVGGIVVLIGMAFGLNSGYAINPARDFGPRLVTMICGWGTGPFTWSDYYFWIPIVGPFIGGPLGCLIYEATLGWHYPKPNKYN
ncbi:hypothetical protein SARC_06621 [Sphaeroforma arctica JP610]|uniref:Aquaporin n=1 Tax=Sphaeroforma arctica JP610 TaxID=667725 RepID=A0A0L0FWM9_9EUKA|nr:hypothetical protein SARC_06621 [Sphaeroforma arctica JP610]KNC81044.1 hypothetical protein SARC_06621 [Sphaeroforma arctica JP610]|eukprot:XP_014154946.1 hypothetical protein SARC_06621 [Sphaeroforma arctica JP610]